MQRWAVLILVAVVAALGAGCQLREIRSRSKVGPQFRHRGSNRTNSVRWAAQQGFDFKWKNGITTGVTYQRRDTDNGNGNNDNGILFRVSFPIWKAKKKPDPLQKRIAKLEERLAELEAMVKESRAH